MFKMPLPLSRIIILLPVFLFSCELYALNTARIDVVRSKDILIDADYEVIDDFIASAISEFTSSPDFHDIASLRSAIVIRSSSSMESGQIQYAPRFFITAQKHISSALSDAAGLTDSLHRRLLTMNLLILVHDLANLELSDLAVDYLGSPDFPVRYWAVKCLCSKGIVKQLNMTESEQNRQLAERYSSKLLSMAETETSGDILILLCDFASSVSSSDTAGILTTITDRRVKQYLSWQVADEQVDSFVLASLMTGAATDADNKSSFGRAFGRLYSMAIQRYVLGKDVLSQSEKDDLVSIIAQGEKYVNRYVPDWPGSLKRALERNDMVALLTAADDLLGSASAAGRLPAAMAFDYGKTDTGNIKTAPDKMSEPAK